MNQGNSRDWDSRPRGVSSDRSVRSRGRGSGRDNAQERHRGRDRGQGGRGSTAVSGGDWNSNHRGRGRGRDGDRDEDMAAQSRSTLGRDRRHGDMEQGSSPLSRDGGRLSRHHHRPSSMREQSPNDSNPLAPPLPTGKPDEHHASNLLAQPETKLPVPAPVPLARPPTLDLSPADQLKLATVQGLMQPYLPFWVQSLPASQDDAMTPLPHFIHTCCRSLSKWLQESSPQVMTRWLVDVWLGLYAADSRAGAAGATSKDKGKIHVKITIFDAVWTMWATLPSSTCSQVEPVSVVVGALAAFASRTQEAGNSASLDPSRTMPFAALIHLVDFQSPSSLHTLIADPILRNLSAMDFAAIPSELRSTDSHPPPSKRPRAHHHDRDRHQDNSRSTPSIPPPIPPFQSPTLALVVSTTNLANLTRLFWSLLAFSPPLDSLRDSLLLQTSDLRLKLSFMDTFISHCASSTTPSGLTSLDLSTTYLTDLYTCPSSLDGVTRSLLRRLPMDHITTKPTLLAIVHAYFSQPTAIVSPHALFADLDLSAQNMLDLMLALASAPSTTSSPTSSPLWMHHILIPVLDSLVGAADLAAVPQTIWDVFCHVLDTPVLARMFLRQLRDRDGPLVAAVRRVVVGYSPTAQPEASESMGAPLRPTCAHGQAPAPWTGSADHVPLMLREWTWRWTTGHSLVDPGVLEDLVRVNFTDLPALSEMQRKVIAVQVNRYVETGSPITEGLVQRLVQVLITVEHAPREAAAVLAVILGVSAKNPALLMGVLARGLYHAFSEAVDADGDSMDLELPPEDCARVLDRMSPLLLHMPMCTSVLPGDGACPVVHGLVAMLFGSNKTFGLVLHRVFHYASSDVAQGFLTWLSQLAAQVPPCVVGPTVAISAETVAGAILYTANADMHKASGMVRVLEQIGKSLLSAAATVVAKGMHAELSVRAELYDYLLFEFFKEFTRLADKRVSLESVHSLWNRNARSHDGHAHCGGHEGDAVSEKDMIALGIDCLALSPSILDPSSSRRSPSQSDWAHATEAATVALTHLHQRLDHLAVGFTVLYRAWDLQQIDVMLTATAGVDVLASDRVPLLSHIVNILTMTGTHPETGISWSFPSPYLLQVLARIGSSASAAFVTHLGHHLADQLGQCNNVPNTIVNATYKAVYAVITSALQQEHDPTAKIPFALLVNVFASVLVVEEELWPMWQRAVAGVPDMHREQVTRDMYQTLVQQVLGPVEQRAAVDLWWCTVEGVVRRKVPMPV